MKEKTVFEDDLKKLQRIVEDLSSGKLTLGESLKKYEEGVKIAQSCALTLADAERKVELLMKKEGKFSLERFDNPDTVEDK
ncbi:MAG: exodeoxyribonuclease VII small subunit [Candidatus Omnitrophica bacterium]|jgi:exodeoxyribonuclease VII small subunit|nr:exodeoxyribonuclease VII small subunit [Candidatus Omnitrophota bacterium]